MLALIRMTTRLTMSSSNASLELDLVSGHGIDTTEQDFDLGNAIAIDVPLQQVGIGVEAQFTGLAAEVAIGDVAEGLVALEAFIGIDPSEVDPVALAEVGDGIAIETCRTVAQGAEDEDIIAGAASQDIGAMATIQAVASNAAVQNIVAITAEQLVIAVQPCQAIVAIKA